MTFSARKSSLTALAIAGVAALTLSACSSTNGGSTAADNGKIDGKITVWSWTAPAKGLRAAATDFEKLHPGVKIDVQDVGNPAIWDKITTGMAAGGAGLADVLNIGIDYMGNYVEKFPNQLVDLSQYGADKLAKDFPAGAWKSGTGADGKVYGIPYEVNATGFFYRTDIFQQAGVDPSSIKTWDDLLAAGKTIKDKTGVPLMSMDKAATQGDSGGLWQLLANQQDSFYFNAQGEITINNAAGVTALEIIKKANDAGIVEDRPGTWDNLVAAMKGDKPVATFTAGGWMAGEITHDAPDMAGKWGVQKPPAVRPGGLTAAINGGTYLSVSNTSKNKATAAAFVQYAMGTVEGQKATYDAGGMFPGFEPFIGSKDFSTPMPYYDNAKVNDIFIAQLKEKTPVVNYTSDYARALKVYTDAQTEVLLKGADPKKALDEAAKLLAQQTGRKIAKD